MSWDIFAMDLPEGIRSIEEIPHDWQGGDLGPRSALIAKILEVLPEADFSDPSWGRVTGDGWSIELNIGDEHPVQSLAFHVRGGGEAAVVVDRVLKHLGIRAIDGPSGELFTLDAAQASFEGWQAYRDRVIDE